MEEMEKPKETNIKSQKKDGAQINSVLDNVLKLTTAQV